MADLRLTVANFVTDALEITEGNDAESEATLIKLGLLDKFKNATDLLVEVEEALGEG